MTDIDRAIEAFERATEGSRGLDELMSVALGFRKEGFGGFFYHWPGQSRLQSAPPPYSENLQHAVEAVPLHHEWIVGVDYENRKAWATVDDDVWDEAMGEIAASGRTPCLALCLAILRVLKFRQTQ